jgi:hypothetical protein
LSISSLNNSRIVDLIELPPVAVHPVLHPALVVEELGGGQDHGAHDGPGRGGRLRGNSQLVQLCMAFFSLKEELRPLAPLPPPVPTPHPNSSSSIHDSSLPLFLTVISLLHMTLVASLPMLPFSPPLRTNLLSSPFFHRSHTVLLPLLPSHSCLLPTADLALFSCPPPSYHSCPLSFNDPPPPLFCLLPDPNLAFSHPLIPSFILLFTHPSLVPSLPLTAILP